MSSRIHNSREVGGGQKNTFRPLSWLFKTFKSLAIGESKTNEQTFMGQNSKLLKSV